MLATHDAISTVLGWIDEPRENAGLHWLSESSSSYFSYAELAARVRGVSQQLRERGLRLGDVVALADSPAPDFISAFYGSLHAGARVLPLPPPILLATRGRDFIKNVVTIGNARFLLASSKESYCHYSDLFSTTNVLPLQLNQQQLSDLVPAVPPDVALYQFTSGSTGSPKGISLSLANLASNITSIQSWLEVGLTDCAASWLPLHHDMGLIGLLLTPISSQITAYHMAPQTFLSNPIRWLECFASGATLTAVPTFAFSYLTRRISRDQLKGMDFSRWRVAISGAERLNGSSLRGFADLLDPFGFSPKAFRPAYGLAEATLAVTGHPCGSIPHAVILDNNPIAIGDRVPVKHCDLLTALDVREGPNVLVESGAQLPGCDVWIVDSHNRPLPEQILGEIKVRGRAVGNGYLGTAAKSETRFEQEWLLTGDAGFLLHGRLYVLGRIADSLKVRGRRIYVEELEAEIIAQLGTQSNGRVTVVATHYSGGNGLAIMVDERIALMSSDLAKIVRMQVGPGVKWEIFGIDSRTVPRTSSGKPQRRQLWQEVHSGKRPTTLLAAG